MKELNKMTKAEMAAELESRRDKAAKYTLVEDTEMERIDTALAEANGIKEDLFDASKRLDKADALNKTALEVMLDVVQNFKRYRS